MKTNRGLIDTPEYIAYINAKMRCTKPERKDWKDYGGRGIKFKFTSFREFISSVGLKPNAAYMLDREDNNGHYETGNCRWVMPDKSRLNQRESTIRNAHLKKISTLGAKVSRESGQASTIAHIRWHVKSGIVKSGCALCAGTR